LLELLIVALAEATGPGERPDADSVCYLPSAVPGPRWGLARAVGI